MNAILRSISFMVLLSEILASSSRFSHQKCGLYGMPPCIFVPAMSGVTPVCASPGKTYCEFVPNYPEQAVRLLLDKWGIDNVNDLIVDETVDEFEATGFNDIPFEPKPPNPHQTPSFPESHPDPNIPVFPQDGGNGGHGGQGGNGSPIGPGGHGGPVGPGNGNGGGYNYPNPNKVPTSPQTPYGTGTSTTNNRYLPDSVNHNTGLSYTVNHNPGGNRWWSGYSYSQNQRYVRDLSLFRYTRNASVNNTVDGKVATPTNRSQRSTTDGRRTKRQSPGRQQLCETNFQYITPQAALNSQGNWVYVVNMVSVTQQLVRTETCASSVCSNLCSLPNGYSSKCEQKFVQKRLIALNAEGTNLYTDTFWFPSCCVCTINGPV